MVYFLDRFCHWNCLINAKVSIFFLVKCVSDGLFISKLYQNKLRNVTFSIAYIFCCTKLKLHSALYLKICHNAGNSNYGVIDNITSTLPTCTILSPLMLWVRISIRTRCTTLYNKVCHWLTTGRWFSQCPPPIKLTSRI